MKNRNNARWKEEGLLKTLLFLLFPPKCALCGDYGHEGLCPDCREQMEHAFSPRAFLPRGGSAFADRTVCLFSYENEEVRTLLLDWKEHDLEDLEAIFGDFAGRKKVRELFPPRLDLVTFVPRRTLARNKTGHDQAEIFARSVGQAWNIPYGALLKRKGFSRAQHHLKGDLRRHRNIHGVFAPKQSFTGETILLVDDIVTSGASVMECARVLKKAGAMKVFVLCVAH